MTSKHFLAVANSLKLCRPAVNKRTAYKQWLSDAKGLANLCGHYNEHFDRDRFMIACGDESVYLKTEKSITK